MYLSLSLVVKFFFKLVNTWQSYGTGMSLVWCHYDRDTFRQCAFDTPQQNQRFRSVCTRRRAVKLKFHGTDTDIPAEFTDTRAFPREDVR